MPIDETREVTIGIDDYRSIEIVPLTERGAVVLTAQDPSDVVVIELDQSELRELIEALRTFVVDSDRTDSEGT